MAVMTESVLGHKVRYYRKLRGMTQEELAEKVSVAPTHITNIERGKKGVSLEVLLHICRRLEINLMDVLPDESKQVDGKLKEKLIAETADALRKLEITQIEFLKTMISSIND